MYCQKLTNKKTSRIAAVTFKMTWLVY